MQGAGANVQTFTPATCVKNRNFLKPGILFMKF